MVILPIIKAPNMIPALLRLEKFHFLLSSELKDFSL